MLHLTVQLDAALDPGTLTNIATVDSPTVDPDEGNNTATDDVDVDTTADLSIVKSHTQAARVGDPLKFTLAVTNHGPSVARQVTVRDALPAGLTFVSATGDGWTCTAAAGVVTCDLAGPLAAGADATPITLVVTVEPGAYPAVDNTATVHTTTPDPKPGNDSSTDHVTVPPLVDLAISKSHRDPVSVGKQATYRLKVVNHGPTADPGPVRVTDVLPDGLTFVSATGPGWDCSAAKSTVTCVAAAGLKVGETSTITLKVTVGPAAFPSVVNVATVTSGAEDTDSTNNTASDPATVRSAVELTVDKTLLSLTHSTATYRITVGNRGPNNTSTDIVVVDELPAALSYVEVSGRGWTCQAAAKTVTCTYPDVLEGPPLHVVRAHRLGGQGHHRRRGQPRGGDRRSHRQGPARRVGRPPAAAHRRAGHAADRPHRARPAQHRRTGARLAGRGAGVPRLRRSAAGPVAPPQLAGLRGEADARPGARRRPVGCRCGRAPSRWSA